MTKETSHAEVTDPNVALAGASQHSLIGMIALVIILVLLGIAGWSLYDWSPQKATRAAPVAPPTQMEKR